MLAVVCHLWGDKYTEAHVYALKLMVARHLSVPHTFYCVSDRHQIDGVNTLPLIPLAGERGTLRNFTKLRVFDARFQTSLGDRILCLDLDAIIRDDITDIVMDSGEFAIMEGTTDRNTSVKLAPYNSSMWVCESGARHHVFSEYNPARIPEIDSVKRADGGYIVGSDQAWIAYVSPGEKTFGKRDGVVQFFTTPTDECLNGARVVFFAGRVKPWHDEVSQNCPKIFQTYKEVQQCTAQ